MNKVDRGERVQANMFADLPVNKRKKPKPHTDVVLEHLKTLGPISVKTAWKLYGITRLSRVIHDLKKHHIIETKGKQGEFCSYKYVAPLADLRNA